ncbi:MAG: T9SS type A sorting domain-containing protein, partial [Bacteroidetes bacterium]|nr:T9SS type A sorting domain-containing protein [Bacteroidota bacterium]
EFLNVSYRVDHQSNVVIELYDINGNLVREFINEEKSAGTYNHSFSDLSTLAKGTYLLNVTVDHNRSVKKVLFQ